MRSEYLKAGTAKAVAETRQIMIEREKSFSELNHKYRKTRIGKKPETTAEVDEKKGNEGIYALGFGQKKRRALIPAAMHPLLDGRDESVVSKAIGRKEGEAENVPDEPSVAGSGMETPGESEEDTPATEGKQEDADSQIRFVGKKEQDRENKRLTLHFPLLRQGRS
jgi:hypothetical protein